MFCDSIAGKNSCEKSINQFCVKYRADEIVSILENRVRVCGNSVQSSSNYANCFRDKSIDLTFYYKHPLNQRKKMITAFTIILDQNWRQQQIFEWKYTNNLNILMFLLNLPNLKLC